MSRNKNCIVCNSKVEKLIRDSIMSKYTIDYYFCDSCYCIYTEEPFWLEESYVDPITYYDTGIMLRNVSVCEKLMLIFNKNFENNIKVVDYGGGYGILTRMLRDRGVDAYWSDIFSDNLLASGFEYNGKDKIDVMLAFEVVEHLPNPKETFKEILSKTDCFIFSTKLLQNYNYTSNKEWWYFMPETGQHLFFPSRTTMLKLADLFDCRYQYVNGLHILHRLGTLKDFTKNNFNRILLKGIRGLKKLITSDNTFKSKTWDDHLKMKSKYTYN